MKHKIYTLMFASALLAFPVAVPAADYSTMSSKDVQIIQQALADGGFYRSGVDGLYGPATVNAIRSFQHSKGFEMTGVLDETTLRMLSPSFASSKQIPDQERVNEFVAAERARINQERMNREVVYLDDDYRDVQNIAPASGTATILNDKMTTRHPVHQNISTRDVRDIQEALHDEGYYKNGRVDGIWGRMTAGAVREFQSDQGLSVTGTANAETRDALGL
jgi:peptidoglycan hydrolase-like protein with peptidoglycan-binding domain